MATIQTDIQEYFRPCVRQMHGYVPGEQPRDRTYVKLNTNENPYPPSPAVAEALRACDPAALARYPDPVADDVRRAAADLCGVALDQVIAGNGSDDILTLCVRAFVDQDGCIATIDPTYSLYTVLAQIQDAELRAIALAPDFSLPDSLAQDAAGADLLFLPCPNAPSGNLFDDHRLRQLCEHFDGMILLDEAYVDFAARDQLALVTAYDNVIVSRTLSKSYSLAGIRLGYAVSRAETIAGLMKVKDSYNVNALTQRLGAAALRDQGHLRANIDRVVATREATAAALTDRGFNVVPSQANFLFCRPPTDAAELFARLRDEGILVRYFGDSPRTRDFLRITIGTDADMQQLLQALDRLAAGP